MNPVIKEKVRSTMSEHPSVRDNIAFWVGLYAEFESVLKERKHSRGSTKFLQKMSDRRTVFIRKHSPGFLSFKVTI